MQNRFSTERIFKADGNSFQSTGPQRKQNGSRGVGCKEKSVWIIGASTLGDQGADRGREGKSTTAKEM